VPDTSVIATYFRLRPTSAIREYAWAAAFRGTTDVHLIAVRTKRGVRSIRSASATRIRPQPAEQRVDGHGEYAIDCNAHRPRPSEASRAAPPRSPAWASGRRRPRRSQRPGPAATRVQRERARRCVAGAFAFARLLHQRVAVGARGMARSLSGMSNEAAARQAAQVQRIIRRGRYKFLLRYRALQQRRPHGQPRTMALAFAAGHHNASVRRDQVPDDRQPQSKPAVFTLTCRL
jgi:hypothetical protein